MAWVFLFLASLFEVGWAVGLKYTDGFTKPLPTALTVISMATSLLLLAMAVRTLPLGTSYAIWTGVGAVGSVVLGAFLFSEAVTAWRLFFLLLIVGGVVGMKCTA